MTMTITKNELYRHFARLEWKLNIGILSIISIECFDSQNCSANGRILRDEIQKLIRNDKAMMYQVLANYEHGNELF